MTSTCTRSAISVKPGRRQQVAQQRELRLDGRRVEHQPVDRDQHADRREQRQRGVEGAARRDQRDAVGDHLVQGAADHGAPAAPGDLRRECRRAGPRRRRPGRGAARASARAAADIGGLARSRASRRVALRRVPVGSRLVASRRCSRSSVTFQLRRNAARSAGVLPDAARRFRISSWHRRDFPLAPGGRPVLSAPPRSNARASGPQGLRNDVKRSGNPASPRNRRLVLGRWFVRPFRQLRPPPRSGGRPAQGEAGRDDPKDRPFPGRRTARRRRAWCSTSTGSSRITARCATRCRSPQIYYAVKANPAAPILERLVGLGSRFDAASFEEIEACLAAGAAAGRDQLRQHDQEGVARSSAPTRRA